MTGYDEIIASSPMFCKFILFETGWVLFAVIVVLREQIEKNEFQLWWIDKKTNCSGVIKVLVCLIFAFVSVSLAHQVFDYVHIESLYIMFISLSIIKPLLANISIDLAKIGTAYISFAPPLYFFYFKEQRAVSESFMTDVEVPILNIFVICCIGSGLLFIDKDNKFDTVFDLIYLMILALWVFLFIRSIMNRLRPKLLMHKAMREVEECLSIILVACSGKIQMGNHEQALHGRLNLAFEIYYQILAYAIQKMFMKLSEMVLLH